MEGVSCFKRVCKGWVVLGHTPKQDQQLSAADRSGALNWAEYKMVVKKNFSL